MGRLIDGSAALIHNAIENNPHLKFELIQGGIEEIVEVLFERLYEEIKHGDEEQQKWLKNKIEKFKQGL